jgi:hypothetical protein
LQANYSEACERNFEEIAERLGKEQIPSFLAGGLKQGREANSPD